MTAFATAFAPGLAGYLPKLGDQPPAARAAGKDTYGYTMAERLLWQEKQLTYLEHILQPKVFAKLKAWALKQNAPALATDGFPKGQHNVPCGMQLYEWLMKHGEVLSEIN